jgi:hypothetical protein
VIASTLAFPEQIALFAGAHFVAGPHGAGLANAVWAAQPELVSELFEPWLIRDCFARLAVALGASYRPFFAQADSGPQGAVPAREFVAGARGGSSDAFSHPVSAATRTRGAARPGRVSRPAPD